MLDLRRVSLPGERILSYRLGCLLMRDGRVQITKRLEPKEMNLESGSDYFSSASLFRFDIRGCTESKPLLAVIEVRFADGGVWAIGTAPNDRANLPSQSTDTVDPASATQQVDVANEESLPQEPKEHKARLAKNTRYNSHNGYDLTKQTGDSFIEQVWPRSLPVIPVRESAVTVIGKVVRMQPYLSADHSRIYTELTIQPEEIVKSDVCQVAAPTLVIDRIGGAFKTRSGQIVRDDIMIDGLGRTHVGGRYVLFAKRTRRGNDIMLVRGYELRDGRVFKLNDDGSPGTRLISSTPGVADTPSEEGSFLQAVRERAGKQRVSGLR
jgi:hypothetical protein